MLASRTKGDHLRRLAGELEQLASAYDTPSRTLDRAERLISWAEDIAGQVRGVVRGGRK